MEKLLHVSSNPHVRSRTTTACIMKLVAVALLPAAAYGIYLFGWRALMLITVSIGTCVAAEACYEWLMHKKLTIGDFSAVVTGLLLAMNLPASAPWWIPVIGGIFAILVVKQLFGGLGQNFMNPALAARCFLLISFPVRMTGFAAAGKSFLYDTVSGATPLAYLKDTAPATIDTGLLKAMFFGNIHGTIGETSALLLLIGGLFLVAMKVISLRIPLAYLLSFSVFALVFRNHGLDYQYLCAQLCGGGLMLGAWFMATDYVTSPITKSGQIIFGICLGIFTGLFRFLGASAEGVSYAIIFCNLLVPLIERFTRPAAFGMEKGGKKK